MGSRYEVEVTICYARDLKNVNWRSGDLKPYAVVWIDPSAKCSTKADLDGDTSPVWDDKLTIPLGDRSIDDAVLHIDIVHALDDHGRDHKVKPLIGSARLPLSEVLDEVGVGGSCTRTLKLKRPSGRPQGKLELKVRVLQNLPPPPPRQQYDYYAPPYGQPAPGSRDPYGDYPPAPYGQPPAPYGGGAAPYAAAPPAGYPYSAPPQYGYGAAPPSYGYGAAPPSYGQGGYGAPPASYGQSSYGGTGTATAPPLVVEEKKKSKYGMGTGLAVGAVAGVLGGLAIAEGVDYVEDKIADDAAEKVEEDLGYGGYDDDF